MIQKPTHPLLSDGVDEEEEDYLEENEEEEESNNKRRTTKKMTEMEEDKDDIPVPFPRSLQEVGKYKYQHEIQQIFNKCSLNIPLLEAIKQVPKYTKYLKDLCTVKRTLRVKKKCFLA